MRKSMKEKGAFLTCFVKTKKPAPLAKPSSEQALKESLGCELFSSVLNWNLTNYQNPV